MRSPYEVFFWTERVRDSKLTPAKVIWHGEQSYDARLSLKKFKYVHAEQTEANWLVFERESINYELLSISDVRFGLSVADLTIEH